MLASLSLIRHSPVLRLMALLMGLTGIVSASISPYLSLIAIDRIGLSDSAFAVLLAGASVAGVAASVAAGILTDQRANRRRVALVTAALSVIGPLAMWLHPGPVMLVLCHGLLLPIAGSLMGQSFALTRLALADRPAVVDGVLAVLRALLSFTFLLALLLWWIAFGHGLSLFAIYAAAAVASAAMLLATWRDWPRDGQTDWPDRPSGLGLGQSLREIAHPRVLGRIGLLGAITAGPSLYMIVLGLVFAQTPGRGTSATALFVALVAGFEVPFMLLLGRVTPHFSRPVLIGAGAAIYAAFLLLLQPLAATPAIWLLPVLAGLGGAAILTLPIGYLQDLMAGRPGTGSALMAVQKVAADLICATAFAIGTALGGYTLVAMLGAAVMLAGTTALVLADRPRR